MATIKIACPRCGQKVSGDETFSGTIVECPVCSSEIKFPGDMASYSKSSLPTGKPRSEKPPEQKTVVESPVPPAASPEAMSAEEAAQTPIPENQEQSIPLAAADNWGDVDHEIPSPLFGAISLVCGILGIVTCLFASPLFAPLAIIFGHIALARAKHSPLQPAPGKNLALFGVIIGYLSLLMLIMVLIGAVFFKEPVTQFFEQLQQQ